MKELNHIDTKELTSEILNQIEKDKRNVDWVHLFFYYKLSEEIKSKYHNDILLAIVRQFYLTEELWLTMQIILVCIGMQ